MNSSGSVPEASKSSRISQRKKSVAKIVDSNSSYNYYCNVCKFATNVMEDFIAHLSEKSHKENIFEVNNKFNKPDSLQCRLCDYSTWRDQSFRKHCNTKRHLDKNSAAIAMRRLESVPEASKSSRISQKKKSAAKTVSDYENPSKGKDSKASEGPKSSRKGNENEATEETNNFLQPSIPPIGKKAKGTTGKITSNQRKSKLNKKRSSTEPIEDPEQNLQFNSTKPKEAPRVVSSTSSTDEEPLNQSRFGRVRKQNSKYVRQSCVYNTPEEPQEKIVKSKIDKTKNTSDEAVNVDKISRKKKTVEKPHSEDLEKDVVKPQRNKKSAHNFKTLQKNDSSMESQSEEEVQTDPEEEVVKVKSKGSKEGNKKISRKTKIKDQANDEESEDFMKSKRIKKFIKDNKTSSKKRTTKESQIENEPHKEDEELQENFVKTSKSKKNDKMDKISSKKSSLKKGNQEESLRRTVLNPFKKISLTTVVEQEPVKDVGEILKKVSAKPKTVKERIQNADAMKEFNENHEDDVFDVPSKKSSVLANLKVSTKSTLLSQDPDSDSDQDISVHSARTPVTAYFGKSSLRDLNADRTPGIFAQPESPTVLTANNGFQRQAYIQRTLSDRNKVDRKKKKNALVTTLNTVSSRTKMDKLVDQSTKVIETMGQHVARRSVDEEDEDEDDWFGDDDDQENDPTKMLNMLRH